MGEAGQRRRLAGCGGLAQRPAHGGQEPAVGPPGCQVAGDDAHRRSQFGECLICLVMHGWAKSGHDRCFERIGDGRYKQLACLPATDTWYGACREGVRSSFEPPGQSCGARIRCLSQP